VRYYDQTADVMPRWDFSDLMKRSHVEPAKAIAYEEAFARLESETVVESSFRYAYRELRRIRAEQITGEALTNGMEILTQGLEVQGEVQEGYEAAWAHLMTEYGRVNQLAAEELVPEGNMMAERDEILADYGAREAARMAGQAIGIQTGVPSIDKLTNGFQPGDLVLMCGYTSSGKSMLAAQTAHHAAVHQGKNVFFVTSETTRTMTRRRIVARHSLEEKFNYTQGINSNDLKNGTLDSVAKVKFVEVTADLDANGTYGQLYIAQVPHGATLATVEARVLRYATQMPVDMIVIDYLALLKSARERQSDTQEFTSLLKDAKLLATSFDRGRGVVVVSPWQMNRSKYDEAKKTGYYTLGALSDTSEAEKSPDVLVSMLRFDDDASKVRVQLLKNRDGEVGHGFMLDARFANTYLGEPKTEEALDRIMENT
jgi:replicative DNA helicase